MSRKPRSDSKLLTLTEERQVQIYNWLKHVGYTKTVLLVKKELKISTSTGALHNFWEHWSKQESENRILKAVTAAQDITESAAEHLPLINQATMATLQQAAFETVLAGGDDKRVKDFMNIVLKARALDQADQTLSLRLREFEQKIADASALLTKAKSDGGMTVEAIEQMEQQLGLL